MAVGEQTRGGNYFDTNTLRQRVLQHLQLVCLFLTIAAEASFLPSLPKSIATNDQKYIRVLSTADF